MRWLFRLSDWLGRVPVGIWLLFVISSIGNFVNAIYHLESGQSIYTPDSLPILNEEYCRIISASILGPIFVGFTLLRWRSKKSNAASNLQRWRVFLCASLIVFIGAGVALSVVEWMQDYIVSHQASTDTKEWLHEAQQDAKPTWSMDDAVAWLKSHDFELIMKGERWRSSVRQPNEHYYSVSGEKKLINSGLLVQPAWVEMTFIFNLNGYKYERVEYAIKRYRFRRTLSLLR